MKMGYGELIKQGRKGKGNQKWLAARMLVSEATVSRWENERTRPNLDQLRDLASLLGIPLDTLIEAAGVRLNPPPERRLYEPLAEYLAGFPLESQKAVLLHLQSAVAALAPR